MSTANFSSASHDLVVCSLEPWDEVWRRNQYLIDGLLRRDDRFRVLFIEPAVDPIHDVRSRRRPARGTGLRTVAGYQGRLHAFQPTKWLPRVVGPTADQLLVRATLSAAKALDMQDPLLWINDPAAAPLLQQTDWPTIYDITDDWLLADRPAAELARLTAAEQLLMNRCREVVVCSPRLVQTKSPRRTVRLIGNAVDVAAYQRSWPRPTELRDRDYVLYVGTLHTDRLDVEVCLALAQAVRPVADLVLLGPVALDAADLSRLSALPTVSVLGGRPALQVPAYLQHASVLVVPHVETAFTDSLDPIKLYEYQASGRPIVSTPVAGFRDAVGVQVESAHDLPAAVHKQLLHPRTADAAAAAAPADWSHRVDQMVKVLEEVRPDW